MSRTVSGRLPPDLLRDLDRLGKDAGLTRSAILREVVRRGVAAEKLERALEAYRRRRVSLVQASELAGVAVTVFVGEVRHAGIVRDFDTHGLRQDLEWAKRDGVPTRSAHSCFARVDRASWRRALQVRTGG